MIVGNMHVDCFSIRDFLTFVAVKTRPNCRLPHIFISPTFQTLKWLGIFIHLCIFLFIKLLFQGAESGNRRWSCLVIVVDGTRHDHLKHVLKC
jgi:hypothetical protein